MQTQATRPRSGRPGARRVTRAPRAPSSGAGLPRFLSPAPAGQPLPPAVQADMGRRFGEPLSGVRVHADAAAAASAQSVGAAAYAQGENLVFGAGTYNPQSPEGRGLLAHELTHVVQQRRAGPALQRSGVADGGARGRKAIDQAAEREASDNASRIHQNLPLTATQTPQLKVQGDWLDDAGDLASGAVDLVSDAGGAVADAGGALVDAAGEAIGDVAMALVRRVAPQLVPIIEVGPVQWIRDKVSQAFDGVASVLNALDPSGTVTLMLALFTGLVARAGAILAALLSGDCQPLLDAVDQLKTFVTEVAGEAWDRLTEFLRPIGDFFSDLWAGYGAPAIEWLRNFAGDVWAGIEQFGADIWDWTEPIRSAVGDAWGWVKEQLFGPEDAGSGDSSGGILGWVTGKATEAWDWVKEQTRPVWEPISSVATQVAEMLPPPFLSNFGEQMQQLSGQLNTTASDMGGGDAVADNRESLSEILPSVEQIIAGVRGVILVGGAWISEKVGALGTLVASVMSELRASSILSVLASALGWLETAAQNLVAWAQEQVASLFDLLLQGFDALSPFIQAAAGVVRRLITVVGDLMALPQLILSTVWEAIPCCIREPIKNFVLNQILGRIPVFGQFFTDPSLWPRVQRTAMRILRQVFVDGDLAGAAWSFFQAVLRVLGLPPELVVQVLAKAAQAIGDILTDPVGFLINLLGAVRAGFGLFFERIGTHLLNGVTGWLFGHLREAGITPPADFSVGSVLGFVLQVLGVTVENIFARLALRLDATVVARLRTMLNVATGVWRFISILATEGVAGLWTEIQSQLGNLWDSLLQGVIGWITDAVIGRATRWLMSLLDVTGIMPVINTLIAVYNAIESFIQYLREMLEIASKVLDGILGIAHGQIDAAAGFLESALGDAMPVAIGFLANQFGLGRMSERIRELVETVQGTVNRALDWLIERAISLGQALIDMARRGVSAVRGWWVNRESFTTASGEPHELYFTGEGASAQLTIASVPQSFEAFLDAQSAGANPAKLTLIATARDTHRQLLTKQRTAAPPGASGASGAGTAPGEADAAEVLRLTHELAGMARELMGGDAAGASTAPVFGPLHGGMGSSVTVERLTSVHPPGDQPSVAGGLWETLSRRRNGGTTYYIKGHLLNHHLGGTGASWANLTPLTGSSNTTMSSQFEELAKARVHHPSTPVAVRYNVTATFGRDARASEQAALRASGNPDDAVIADIIAAEQHVPMSIAGSATDLATGQPGTPVPAFSHTNTIAESPDQYDLSGAPRSPAYVSDMSDAELATLAGRPVPPAPGFPNRPYRSVEALESNTGGNWAAMVAASPSRLRLFRR